MLCRKIVEFLQTKPRPADEYLSTHKLALRFPALSTSLELVWIRYSIYFDDAGSWYTSVACKPYIVDALYPEQARREGRMLEIYMGDRSHPLIGSNKCIEKLMQGYQWTKSKEMVSSAPHANVIVMRYELHKSAKKKDASGKRGYLDVTVAGLRFTLNHFGSRVELFHSSVENNTFIRAKHDWFRGVVINSSVDMALNGVK